MGSSVTPKDADEIELFTCHGHHQHSGCLCPLEIENCNLAILSDNPILQCGSTRINLALALISADPHSTTVRERGRMREMGEESVAQRAVSQSEKGRRRPRASSVHCGPPTSPGRIWPGPDSLAQSSWLGRVGLVPARQEKREVGGGGEDGR